MMHTIYHIPGIKVGCTVDFRLRAKKYPKGTEFEIIGDFYGLTHEQAGDIEFLFADIYGYKKGFHYASIQRGNSEQALKTMGVSGRKARSRKGVETLGEEGNKARSLKSNSPEHLARRKESGVKTAETMNLKPDLICPHCGLKGRGNSMLQWHFDRCRNRG